MQKIYVFNETDEKTAEIYRLKIENKVLTRRLDVRSRL